MTTIEPQSPTHVYLEQASSDFGGDPRTNLAIAMIEQANESRHDVREQRLVEERYQRDMEQSEVAKMREEAHEVRAAGEARGFYGIVGGALAATGGVLQLSGTASNARAGHSGTAAGTSGAPATQNHATAWAQALEGGGEIASNFGGLLGARHDGAAGIARADQTAFAHRAEAVDRSRKELDEQASEAAERGRTAIEHLQKISEAEADEARASIFRG